MKNEYIRFRLSEREKELIKNRSKELDMTMSEYIMYLVRLDTRKENKNGNWWIYYWIWR